MLNIDIQAFFVDYMHNLYRCSITVILLHIVFLKLYAYSIAVGWIE